MLIGEVAERSGVSARMLRHYDSIGLVSPSERTSSGYREYTDEDLRRLFHVEGLRSLGLSLKEISDALGDQSFSPTDMVEELITRTHELIAQEEQLLRTLNQVKATAPNDWSDVLHVIGLMRGLEADAPSQRQRAALSLHDDKDRSTALLTEAALTETDPNVAGTLTWALALSGDEAVPILATSLDSPVPVRRHRAMEALQKIGSPLALDALSEAVQSPDPLVSSRAVLARGKRGHGEAIPALVSLIVAGRDDVEAAEVLAELSAHHAERIVELIVKELNRQEEKARLRLAGALADVPGAAAEAALTQLIDDRAYPVALTARSILSARKRGRR